MLMNPAREIASRILLKLYCIRKVAAMLSYLSQWIDGSKDHLNDYTSFDSSSKIWTGQEIAGVFKVYGIDERTLANDLKE